MVPKLPDQFLHLEFTLTEVSTKEQQDTDYRVHYSSYLVRTVEFYT